MTPYTGGRNQRNKKGLATIQACHGLVRSLSSGGKKALMNYHNATLWPLPVELRMFLGKPRWSVIVSAELKYNHLSYCIEDQCRHAYDPAMSSHRPFSHRPFSHSCDMPCTATDALILLLSTSSHTPSIQTSARSSPI